MPSIPVSSLLAAPGHRAGLLALFVLLPGCATVRHVAVDQLGDALAGSGSTFSADDDPALIAAAAPFSLKLMESLLAERPRHPGLLLAATSGFTQYAFAFVHQDADEVIEKDYAAGAALRLRARRLYLRARDYGLRGLEVAHAGFAARLRTNPAAAVILARQADVPLLYWTAAAWGAAISLGKDSPDLLADLPIMEALIDRAVALDAGFGRGALQSLLISYEMVRPTGVGNPVDRARAHFEQAVALGGDALAGPPVTWAEAVCVPRQDRAGFTAALQRALAIDADAHPADRLVNLVMQRRARWLLGRVDELFTAPTDGTSPNTGSPTPAPTAAAYLNPPPPNS